jgi:hypothetical protein
MTELVLIHGRVSTEERKRERWRERHTHRHTDTHTEKERDTSSWSLHTYRHTDTIREGYHTCPHPWACTHRGENERDGERDIHTDIQKQTGRVDILVLIHGLVGVNALVS